MLSEKWKATEDRWDTRFGLLATLVQSFGADKYDRLMPHEWFRPAEADRDFDKAVKKLQDLYKGE